MAQVVAQTERLVAASPQHVRSFLLDYQNNRPRILPPEYFRDYRVEQGGDGAGTIISYWLRAGGRERAYRMRVEEPTEGGPLLMYDFAGQWAYQVGTPAKSGVSGGILAVVPGKLGISVFSPGLDAYGNSVRGDFRAPGTARLRWRC